MHTQMSDRLLVNSDDTPVTRSVLPTLLQKIQKSTQKWAWIGICRLAKPSSSWAACYILVIWLEAAYSFPLLWFWARFFLNDVTCCANSAKVPASVSQSVGLFVTTKHTDASTK